MKKPPALSIKDLSFEHLSELATEAGRDASRRAASAGLRVETVESLRQADAARVPKRA